MKVQNKSHTRRKKIKTRELKDLKVAPVYTKKLEKVKRIQVPFTLLFCKKRLFVDKWQAMTRQNTLMI